MSYVAPGPTWHPDSRKQDRLRAKFRTHEQARPAFGIASTKPSHAVNATTDILIKGFLTTIDLEVPHNYWSTKGQGGDLPLSDLRSRFHSIVRSHQTFSMRPPGMAGENESEKIPTLLVSATSAA